jgi:Helix-turn-helix domain
MLGNARRWTYPGKMAKQVFQGAFRFELDPNQAQRVHLAKSVGASRYVYTWVLPSRSASTS